MKEIYLDIMEKAVAAYEAPLMEEYYESVRREGLSEHGFPRLAANIGVLIAHGRMTHLRPLFIRLMDLCCEEMPVALRRSGNAAVGNEFSVKEIVMCLMTLEKYHAFPGELGRWKEAVRSMDPYAIYANIAPVPPIPLHNWAAFAAASEQLRIHAGLGAPRSAEFVNNQVASQLFNFDENGMYRDPNEPIVYDLTTRLQLAITLHYGFDGANAPALYEMLMRGSAQTMYMQSVTGEIPFGGRSNQFLHNEPTFAALFEYEARQHQRLGDHERAARCRRCALNAAQNTLLWLNTGHVYHIKNGYEPFSGYGCEPYGYFHKYMVTAASFAHFAYLLADDSIRPQDGDEKTPAYIHQTGEHFHKTFIRFGDYFLEYDTRADYHYDCCGLGRVHKKGAPSPICLSLPMTPTPVYGLDLTNPGPLSICAGMESGGAARFSCEEGTAFELMNRSVTEEDARLTWRVTLPGGASFTEECIVTQAGVCLNYAGEGELFALLPAFEGDGFRKSEMKWGGQCAEIRYEGAVCRYEADAPLSLRPETYAGRSGHYRALQARARGRICIRIAIE